MRKILFLASLILFCAFSVRAQGIRHGDTAFVNISGAMQPISNATIRVCTTAATGNPCTPIVSVYADVGMTIPLSNPFTSDTNGNYEFFAPSGDYQIQISGLNIPTYTLNYVQLAADVNSNNTWSGNNSFSGVNLVTGSFAPSGGGTLTANAITQLTTAGDLLYMNGTPVPARLPIGTSGQCLQVSGSLPAWVGCPGSGSAQLSANNAFTGANTFSLINLIHHIDGTTYAKTASGVNAAYTACGVTPCEVDLDDPTVSYTGGVIAIPAGSTLRLTNPGTYVHSGITCAASATANVQGCTILGVGLGQSVLQLAASVNTASITTSIPFARLQKKIITAASRTSNVDSFTCAVTCNFTPGDSVYVEAVSGSTSFAGQYTVATDSGTGFTTAQTAANDTATALGWVANAYGSYGFTLQNITIDGNSGLNTGDCVDMAGRNPTYVNVEIRNCQAVGLLQSSSESTFTGNFGNVNGHFTNLLIHDTGDRGLWLQGPHDSHFSGLEIYNAHRCSEWWASFFMEGASLFGCNANYGIYSQYDGEFYVADVQSESVYIKNDIGYGTPAPNTGTGVSFYGDGAHPALQVEGYDNHFDGWIGDSFGVADDLVLNGGAGYFNFDVLYVGSSYNWINYGSAGRAQSNVRMWGVTGSCASATCQGGTTGINDVVSITRNSAVLVNQTPSLLVTALGASNCVSTNSSSYLTSGCPFNLISNPTTSVQFNFPNNASMSWYLGGTGNFVIQPLPASGVFNSPSFYLGGQYEATSGPTYAEDAWSWTDVVGSGVNGTSTLTLGHAGSTGIASVSIPYPVTLASCTGCLNIFNHSGTQTASTHLVQDTVTLSTGTATVTLTGSSVFTGPTTFACWANDTTTSTNAVTMNLSSGSSVVFTGTGSDVISYGCAGH